MKKIKTLFRIFWLMLIMLALSGLNVLSSAWAADLYYNGSGSVADLGINPIQPGYTLRRVFTVGNAAVSTYTTMDCISLSLSVTQAYYDSYQANVSYRETGSSSWNSAHSLTRSEYDRARYPSEYWWYGSIVGLSAGVDYEIKIVIEPSGGGTAIAEGEFTVRTREEPGRGTILQTLYVSVSGNDSNAGTEQAPLRNIQTALNNAQPGTKVKVLAGTYNESLVINQNGTSENPIILEGGEGVVLDGHTEITAQWNLDGDALYYVSCSEYPSSIDTGSIGQTENRKRLYEYCASSYDVSDLDLDDLRNRAAEAEDLSVSWCPHYSILGGWYYDTVNSKLYVRAEGDNNLNNLSVWVGTPDTAITINGNYVIVEGFEIKYYKKAITASQKRFSIIRGNDIFRCQEGIYFLLLNNISGEDLTELPNWSEVGTAGSEYGHYAGCLNEGTIIEYNTVTDPDTYAWGYGRGKTKPTIETTGVQISGPGSIVRYNYVIGYFKGISASWDVSQTNRDLNRNLDMYNNVVCESTSDSFEPEGNLINVRIWGNKCRDMWTGVSIAPVRYGPMYVWKNIFIDHGLTAFKLSSSTTGYTYIYNNTVKTDVSGIPGWRNSGYWSNVIWKNNIVISQWLLMEEDVGSADNGLELDYNLYYTPYNPGGNILQLRRKSFASIGALYNWFANDPNAYFTKELEKNSLFGDVQFISSWPNDDFPISDMYKPVAGSLSVDSGTIIPNFSVGYEGSAPDIGAVEYESASPDTAAPSAVNNLSAVTGADDGEVDLTWTAPGDDGASGTVNSYDLRYSENQITEDSWQTTEVATNEPSPSSAGSSETMTLSGLTPGQTYYFAIKSQDEVPNISALSNIVSAEAKETIIIPDTTPPYTTGHSPAKSATNIAPNTPVIVHVKDDGAGVDINTIVMSVNSQVVSPTITGTPADYTLTYEPPSDFNYGSTVAVTVEAQDLAP